MNAPTLSQAEGTMLLVGGAIALVAVLYVVKKGPAGLAADGVKAAAGAAGAVATGTVDGVSQVVGLPTTEQTTTDPLVARWIIDNYGYLEATKWAGVPALWDASFMAAGTGTPPPAGSPFLAAHAADAAQAAQALQSAPMDYGNPSTNPYGW